MSAKGERMRGQPLVVLAALLLGWAGARITSFGEAGGPSLPEVIFATETASAASVKPEFSNVSGPQTYAPPYDPQAYNGAVLAQPMMGYAPQVQYIPVVYGGAQRGAGQYGPIYGQPQFGRAQYDRPQFVQVGAWESGPPQAVAYVSSDFPRDHPIAPQRRSAMGLIPGLPALLPAEPSPVRYGEPATVLGGRIARLIGNPARWSMDTWALARKSPLKAPAMGTLPSTYGASQAGSVLRYQLAMENPRQPTAYLRTTSTLGGVSETSVALGVSARPLPHIPIIAAAEGRMTQQGASRRIQPAIMAVTTMPPVSLSGNLQAEVYGQAGYVAGRYATPFADGQLRVDRPLLDVGRMKVRVGAGAWGGVQKGASRLDAGPGATVSMPLSSKVFGRVALDWRIRAAGNAEPDSGPAVTMAAGF